MSRRATVPTPSITAPSLDTAAVSTAGCTAVQPSRSHSDDQGWSVVEDPAIRATGSGPASDQGWS